MPATVSSVRSKAKNELGPKVRAYVCHVRQWIPIQKKVEPGLDVRARSLRDTDQRSVHVRSGLCLMQGRGCRYKKVEPGLEVRARSLRDTDRRSVHVRSGLCLMQRPTLPPVGLEPTQCYHYQILSLTRLPFRHDGESCVTRGQHTEFSILLRGFQVDYDLSGSTEVHLRLSE